MARDITTTLIRGVRVFDGEQALPQTMVLLRGGLIAEVGDHLGVPAGAEVIDAAGQTLLPGLIDAHTHAFPGRLEQALAFGVTTELDMFADPDVAAELKQQAARRLNMADLRSAGTGATAPDGHPCQLAKSGIYRPFPTLTDPGQAEQFVTDRIAEGSDYLKVFLETGTATGFPIPGLPPDIVAALVEAGHRHQLLVIAHATDQTAALVALQAGVDGLAHLFVDRPAEPDLAELVGRRQAFVIPTLVVLEALCGHPSGQLLAGDARFAPYLDTMSQTMLTMGAFPAGPDARRDFDVAVTALAQLHAAGVTILAGTDASNPGTAHGASIHRELELLVAAGLSPAEALTAGTSAPAACFGLTDRGRIEPGLAADLFLVVGDPTEVITATRNIVEVWRRGARLDRHAYRATLTPAPAAAPPATGGEPRIRWAEDGEAIAATARWTAAARAQESARTDRLFDDPLAAVLAGDPGRALLAQMQGEHGEWDNPSLPVRTRFFDDALAAALTETGIGQVVLLAAGMDTRAYRLPLPADTVWFELDRPELLALKDTLLHQADAAACCARRAVGVDLTSDWADPLTAAGFDRHHPTLWLVEGLTAYLDAGEVGRMLDEITDLSAAGSRLLADIVGQSLLDSPWMTPWLTQLAARGMTWRFGTDQPEELFTSRGWQPHVTQISTAGTAMGRWPYPDMPRGTPGMPNSYLSDASR